MEFWEAITTKNTFFHWVVRRNFPDDSQKLWVRLNVFPLSVLHKFNSNELAIFFSLAYKAQLRSSFFKRIILLVRKWIKFWNMARLKNIQVEKKVPRWHDCAVWVKQKDLSWKQKKSLLAVSNWSVEWNADSNTTLKMLFYRVVRFPWWFTKAAITFNRNSCSKELAFFPFCVLHHRCV